MKKYILGALVLLVSVVICSGQDNKSSFPNESQIYFLENKGQLLNEFDQPVPDIEFILKSSNFQVYIGKGKLHYEFSRKKQNRSITTQFSDQVPLKQTEETRASTDSIETCRVDIKLNGINANTIIEAQQPGIYYENYYNVPGHYRDGILNVRSFGKLIMKNIYPNIDWVIYIKNNHLKHEFLLKSGADYRMIDIDLAGPANASITTDGDLSIQTTLGSIQEERPFIPEDTSIHCKFILSHSGENLYKLNYSIPELVGITKNLTIDPGVEWSTFFGGSNDDRGIATAAYKSFLYFGGTTHSSNKISYNGFQNTIGGNQDIFLTRFSEDGIRLWATYYGGIEGDHTNALKATNNGVLFGGSSASSGMAYMGYDTTFAGTLNTDAIIALFDTAGVRIWATYLGNTNWDHLTDLDTLPNGDIAVSGYTGSTGLATSGAHQASNNGKYDGFLGLINSNGQSLKWLTYFGGTEEESILSLRCYKRDIYIAGYTASSSNIFKNGFQSNFAGVRDVFVSKFSSNGVQKWGSYLGSTNNEICYDLEVYNDNIYLTGLTNSGSGFSYGNAYQKNHGGKFDAFISKVTVNGIHILSTYYGNADDQIGKNLTVDNKGILWVNVAHSGSSGLGSNFLFDNPVSFYGQDQLLVRFDTSCNLINSTHYYGNLVNTGVGIYSSWSSGIVHNKDYIITSMHGISVSVAVRSKYQSAPSNAVDALFCKWNMNSFSKPTVIVKGGLCPGNELTIKSLQYAVGRGLTPKTVIEFSDTGGIFNSKTRLIYQRSDSLSKQDSITWTLPKYIIPGKYLIRFRMTSPADSMNSDTLNIASRTFGSISSTTTQICENDSIVFNLDSSGSNPIRWYDNFGPTSNSGDTLKSFVAKKQGKYFALVSSPGGCTTATNSINIFVWKNPVAKIAVNTHQACLLNNQFEFIDSSSVVIGSTLNSRLWDFDNGQSSIQAIENLSYSNPGEFRVKLKVGTNRGCTDSTEQIVKVWSDPIAKIGVNSQNQCLNNNNFIFTDSSNMGNDSTQKRIWRFDNSNVSTSKSFNSKFSTTNTIDVHLYVESIHNCKDSTTLPIKISSSPTADIITAKASFCYGDSAKLEVTNPNSFTYQWIRDKALLPGQTGLSVMAYNSGNYSVKVKSTNGCDSVSAVIKINVFPLPNPNLGPDKNLHFDSSIELSPGIFKAYSWYKGGTASKKSFDKSSLDTGINYVWVNVNDSNNCQGADTVRIRLEPVNGLWGQKAPIFKVYPVPTKRTLLLDLGDQWVWNLSISYKISDLTGRQISTGKVYSSITEIDLGELANGEYILSLFIGNEPAGSVKIIKTP